MSQYPWVSVLCLGPWTPMDHSRGYREVQICPISAAVPCCSHPVHIPQRKGSFPDEAITATCRNERNEDVDLRSPHTHILFLLDTVVTVEITGADETWARMGHESQKKKSRLTDRQSWL